MCSHLNCSAAIMWARKLRIAVAALVTASLLWAETEAAAAEKADLETVVASRRQQEEALKSLFVSYRLTSRLLGEPAEVKQFTGAVALVDERRTFAFKGDKRYYRQERTDNLNDTTASLPDIVERHANGEPKLHRTSANLIYAFDGEVLRHRSPGGQSAAIIPRAEAADDDIGYFNPQYMGMSFRVLPDALNPKNERRINRLPSAIADGKCTLRPEPEVVDGASCVVIEVGKEIVLWCDSAKGYAVRKEEIYHPNTKTLALRTTCSDFAEVCPGVWLPRKAYSERFAKADAPDKFKNIPLLAYNFQVTKLHANDVPDELFTLAIPPGTSVTDYRHMVEAPDGTKVALSYKMPQDEKEVAPIVESLKKKIGELK